MSESVPPVDEHGTTSPSSALVDPSGPVFVSHRKSDGAELAREVAWCLRSFGVPVWFDDSDLGPGDIRQRLREAMRSGLSGAVLIVTEEASLSPIIKGVELPELLALTEDPRFFLIVANAVPADGMAGRMDLAAPDRLLKPDGRPLKDIKQYPLHVHREADATALAATTYQDAYAIALAAVRHRVRTVPRPIPDCLDLDIQSREPPTAFSCESTLVLRTEPPAAGQRRYGSDAWRRFHAFLDNTSLILSTANVRELLVSGGAHLTMGLALGAAVPITARWSLSYIDREGRVWGGEGPRNTSPMPIEPRFAPLEEDGDTLAVFVDLVQSPPTEAFSTPSLVGARPRGQLILAPVGRRMIEPGEALGIVEAASTLIRRQAAESGTRNLALCLRTPFPIALLLGRCLNTLELHLYEWEDGQSPARYYFVGAVASGRGAGV